MNYAQLDFTQNRYKRVNLINHESIVRQLVDHYPNDFVDLEGREDIPLDTFDWHYDTEEGRFLTTAELPPAEPEPVTPPEPANSEVLQTVNDLRAELEIAGVIL